MQYNSLGSSLSYFFRAAFERVLHIFIWSISGLYILADTGCRTAPTCLQQAVLTVGCIGQKTHNYQITSSLQTLHLNNANSQSSYNRPRKELPTSEKKNKAKRLHRKHPTGSCLWWRKLRYRWDRPGQMRRRRFGVFKASGLWWFKFKSFANGFQRLRLLTILIAC